MGQDSYLPLEKSGQSVIDQNLPYRFLRGQPLKFLNDDIFGKGSRRFLPLRFPSFVDLCKGRCEIRILAEA